MKAWTLISCLLHFHKKRKGSDVIPVSIDRVVVFPAPFVPKNPKHSPS